MTQATASNILPFTRAKNEAQAKEICRWLLLGGERPAGVLDWDYLDQTQRMLKAGILGDAMTRRIWEYAFGRPAQVIEHRETFDGISHLTDHELANKIEQLIAVLREDANSRSSQ